MRAGKKIFSIFILALLAVSMAVPTPAQAQEQDWCFLGYENIITEGEPKEFCGYTSLQLCLNAMQDHIWDVVGGTCFPNDEFSAGSAGEQDGSSDGQDVDVTPDPARAVEGNPEQYVPLAPLPFTTADQTDDSGNKFVPTGSGDFSNFVNGLVKIAIAAASALAVLMMVIGGFQYMTTDAATGKAQGKEKMWAALGGLVLALASVLILQTINPNILDIRAIEQVKITVADVPEEPGWYYTYQFDEDINNENNPLETRFAGPFKTEKLCEDGEVFRDKKTVGRAEATQTEGYLNVSQCFSIGTEDERDRASYCFSYTSQSGEGQRERSICSNSPSQCEYNRQAFQISNPEIDTSKCKLASSSSDPGIERALSSGWFHDSGLLREDNRSRMYSTKEACDSARKSGEFDIGDVGCYQLTCENCVSLSEQIIPSLVEDKKWCLPSNDYGRQCRANALLVDRLVTLSDGTATGPLLSRNDWGVISAWPPYWRSNQGKQDGCEADGRCVHIGIRGQDDTSSYFSKIQRLLEIIASPNTALTVFVESEKRKKEYPKGLPVKINSAVAGAYGGDYVELKITTAGATDPPYDESSSESARIFSQILGEESGVRTRLRNMGIGVDSADSSNTICGYVGDTLSCTNVGGLSQSMLMYLESLVAECRDWVKDSLGDSGQCSITITGGVEWWKHGNRDVDVEENETQHKPRWYDNLGRVVDLRLDRGLDSFIRESGRFNQSQSKFCGWNLWERGGGASYEMFRFEETTSSCTSDNHWHVQFGLKE